MTQGCNDTVNRPRKLNRNKGRRVWREPCGNAEARKVGVGRVNFVMGPDVDKPSLSQLVNDAGAFSEELGLLVVID